MKDHLLKWMWAAAAVLLAPGAALAQRGADQPDVLDARLEGYPNNITIEGATTSLTWLLLVFLTIVCLAVLFKDARRTHLD